MPHALLLHGASGVGKRRLATLLARQLLCETHGAERSRGGCGRCASCHWFDQGNHPDHRLVTSDALASAAGAEAGAETEGGDVDGAGAKAKKAPSRDIRVEQIRALAGFLAVGTHRDGYRVVQLQPLEALNEVASNALLKMLEEPPSRTLFVLVADRVDGVAPTIVSRCQKVAVAIPARAESIAWLEAQGVRAPETALAASGGAPLGALEWALDDAGHALHEPLLAFLSRPGSEAALALAEALGKAPPAAVIGWMQRWLADALSQKLTGRVRYHPSRTTELATVTRGVDVEALLAFDRRLSEARRSAEHPLNTRLMLESLLLEYVDAFRGLPA